jgi:hypothetical protein
MHWVLGKIGIFRENTKQCSAKNIGAATGSGTIGKVDARLGKTASARLLIPVRFEALTIATHKSSASKEPRLRRVRGKQPGG